MKRIFSFLLALVIFFTSTLAAYADYSNITGGSGTTGTGTNDNGWLISNTSGWYTYDAEGIRVYVVNKAGEPVTGSIDITNETNLVSSILNGGGKTKFAYLYKASSFAYNSAYLAKYPPTPLPSIIPWGESSSATAARIEAIKEWIYNQKNRDWLFTKLGTTEETMRDKGYKFAIEPIAYFRYMGVDYALTATECAVLDKTFSGGIYSKMNPLTHSNLPLSMYLEKNEFTAGAYPLYAWTDKTTKTIRDDDTIIEYLGIGIFSYSPDNGEKEDPNDLSISISVEATPKEYEVIPPEGFEGLPCQLGRDGYLTVDLKQTTAVYNAWKERLEGVDTVTVTFNAVTKTGKALTGMSGSSYNYGTRTMSTTNFLALLKKQIKYKDKVTTNEIEPGGRIEYLYRFRITVKFIESDRYSTAGQTVVVSSNIGEDTASFFRKNDNPKPEYVTYTSEPKAYAELKEGTVGNETFEAMAGVPTTEDLYLGVGGSEFIVDFEAEYNQKQEAYRTYKVHYDGTDCEFRKGDQSTVSFTFPSPSGGGTGNTTVSNMYNGATLSVTWTGTTKWTGSTSISGIKATVVNTWDDSTYNAAKTAAQKYVTAINSTVFSYTSASDKTTRTYKDWGAAITTDNNVHIPGTATDGVIKNGVVTTQPSVTKGKDNTWTITVTWTIPKYCCAGPCHDHVLPAIEDTWKQKVTYDNVKITKAVVWALNQGLLNSLAEITGGTLTEANATILQGAPTMFCNIAASETSKAGRFRYSLEAASHDNVVWNLGTRSNKCDKQGESWGTGIKYSDSSYKSGTDSNGSNSLLTNPKVTSKDKATDEYKTFIEYRNKFMYVDIISDILILQTSSGDQSVLYYTKRSEAVRAYKDIPYVQFSLNDAWTNNPTSAAKWSKDHINIGSYNGRYAAPTTKYNGSGSSNKIATIFDSDPANTVNRPNRPGRNLIVAKYGIDILNTLPNDDYRVGNAYAFWKVALNYNPKGTIVPYSTKANLTFGNASGYSKIAKYSEEHTRINDIVVHDPVSTEYAMILEIDENRDQRVSTTYADKLNSYNSGCPGTAEECEFSYLDCHYSGSHTHTSECYSATTPKTNNAHQHTLNCLDENKLAEAYQKDTVHTANSETYDESKTAPSGAPFSKYKIQKEFSLSSLASSSDDFTLSSDKSYVYCSADGAKHTLNLGTLSSAVEIEDYLMLEIESASALVSTSSHELVVHGSGFEDSITFSVNDKYIYIPLNKYTGYSLSSSYITFYTKSGSVSQLKIKSVSIVNSFVNYGAASTISLDGLIQGGMSAVSGGAAGSIPGGNSSQTFYTADTYNYSHKFTSDEVALALLFKSVNNLTATTVLTLSFTDSSQVQITGQRNSNNYVIFNLPSSVVGKTLKKISIGLTKGYTPVDASFSISPFYIMSNKFSSTQTMTPPISKYIISKDIGISGWAAVPGSTGNATVSSSKLTLAGAESPDKFYKSISYVFKSDEYLVVDVDSVDNVKTVSTSSFVDGTFSTSSQVALKGDTTIWIKIPNNWVGKTATQIRLNLYPKSGTSKSMTINSIKVVRDGKYACYKGESWGLVDMEEILVNGTPVPTLAWLRKQQSAILFKCRGELNVHICDAACQHDAVLVCNEPHHYNEHYDSCYVACHDDDKHRQQTSTPGDSLGASIGNFINLDWGFQVYFPTVGNFYQSSLWGIPSITQTRGKGYYDNMETAEWVDKKRVKFAFDVIYCGAATERNKNGSQHGNSSNGSDNHKHTGSCVLYKAGEWIELPKDYELFNFYCPASNFEYAGAAVEFEVVAINSPTGENDGNTQATNRMRYTDLTAKHGTYRKTYVDVVGRIGNVIIEDTGDFRYSNLFKQPVETDDYYIDGLVKEVDITKKNFVITSTNDLRGLPTGNIFGQDTYGTLSWLKRDLLPFPLSPDKNNINALKNEPLRFGYSVFADVSTIGIDYGTIDIVPCYYHYDLSTNKVTPLDVYMIHDDKYQPVNIYRNAYEDRKEVYSYNYYLEWERQYQRRNVSSSEQSSTTENAERNKLLYPSGKYKLGNADFLSFDERARTYIGSTSTMGYSQNPGKAIEPSFFQMAAKRWHFTLGLPSSTVVVEHGTEVTTENIEKFSNGTGVVLMTADIYSTSNLYTLKYSQSGGQFTINGITYPLPSNIPFVMAIFGDNSKSSKDDLEIHHTH